LAKNQADDVTKMLEKLYSTIKDTSQFTREQVKINRDLLKVLALLNDGFVKSKEDADNLIQEVTSGVEDVDAFLVKWAKDRQASKKDLEELRKKFKEIKDIDDDMLDNVKDYVELVKERQGLLEDEADITSNLLKYNNDILATIRASKSQYSQISGVFKDVEMDMRKIVSRNIDFSGMFNDGLSSLGSVQETLSKVQNDIDGMISNVSGNYFEANLHFNPLTDDLDKEITKTLSAVEQEKNARLDGLNDYFAKNKQLQTNLARQMAGQSSGMDIKVNIDTGEIKTASGLLKRGTLEFQKMGETLDVLALKSNSFSEINSTFKEINNLVALGSEKTSEQVKRLTELLTPMGIAVRMLTEQVDLKVNQLQFDTEQINKQKILIQNTQKYMSQLKTAESIVQKVGRGFDYINQILPVGISEFIGLSRVSNDLLEGHKRGVTEFVAGMQKGSTQAEAMQGYFKALKPSIAGVLTPTTLLITAFVLLYKFAESLVNKYKDMTSEMKISLNQAHQLLDVQLDTLSSTKNQFATLSDIQAVQTAMIGSSGKVFDLTNKDAKELSINLVEVGKYFGYGNTQAVELHKTFKMLGADNKFSLQLQRQLGYMSEMAGISPHIVAQDMVDATETVATYFGGMPEKAMKAAVEIRKMGLSLQQAGSIAQKMLNLEGFMTDMYELQAMSGGGIDFSQAFDRGIMGDLEGMTESIMKNMGGSAKFAEMDYKVKMKIANTLGMSVAELAKSVKFEEQIGNLTKEQQGYLKANQDRMGDISNLSQEDIQNRLAQLQSTDRLGVAWEKIKGVLFSALIPLAESLGEAIDAISPILDLLIFGFKGIAGILRLISPIVKGILMPFKLIGEGLSIITSKVEEWSGSLKVGEGIVTKISGALQLLGGAIGLFFAPKILSMFFGAILSGFKIIPMIGSLFGSTGGNVKKTFADVGTNITTTFAEVGTTIKTSMENVANTIKEVFSSTNAGISDLSATAQSMTADVSKNVKAEMANVGTSTVKMTKDVDSAVEKTKKKLSKPSTIGFLPSASASGAFKTIGEIGSKAFAAMAIKSAMSFMTVKKEGEAQTSEMASNMSGIMELAFAGSASMLSTYLMEGVEKVFTKRLEKKLESGLENPIKKMTKAFTSVEGESTGVFSRIVSKGKSVFGKLGDFMKKISLAPNVSGTFDGMASSAKKAIEPIETVQNVVEKVQTLKTESIDKTIKKTVNVEPEKVQPMKTLKGIDNQKPIRDVGKKIGTGFDSVTNIMKFVWNGLKTVLTDIVKFVSTSMKELSSGIGTAIKNILKGIGDGLSSFKSSALKGAATMLVLSAALWVTSKAVANFASVKWEDLAKAGVALVGLAAISLVLGSASTQMIIGAVAIGLLGAALIPAAYALNMFNDVEWSSLAKAGVALIGLGVMAAALGSFVPLILLGAIAIAALGVSIIPLAIGMKMFNDVEWDSLSKAGVALIGFGASAALFAAGAPVILTGAAVIAAASLSIMLFAGSMLTLNLSMKGLDLKPIMNLGTVLKDLISIPISSLLALSGAVNVLGASILSFQSMSSVGSVISGLFGNDVVNDLQKLANLANPLYIVAESIGKLSESLQSLENIDLTNLSKLPEFSIDAKVQKKIEPEVQSNAIQRDSTQVKIAPVQQQVAQVQPPKKEAVAQEKMLEPRKVAEADIRATAAAQKMAQQDIYNSSTDNYDEKMDMVSDFTNLESYMQQTVQLLQLLVKKDVSVNMDSQRITSIIKAKNNN